MELQPKFTFDKSKRKYVAQKIFTDREKPQEIFERNINTLTDNLVLHKNIHQVLVYYGIGGIGKTALKNKLKEKVHEMSNALALEIDFRNIRSRECSSGLLELANSVKLNNKTKNIKFIHFELAYAIYFKKKNPDYSFSDDNESIFGKFDLGIELLSNIDPIGIVGISKTLVEKLYSVSKRWKLDRELKEHFNEFIDLPLNEMEAWLPTYFAYDLNKYIDKSGIKVVVFMDTFEALNDYETHELKKVAKQEWVQELIKNLPNVLFTVFGREKLIWGNEWENYLEQHLLSELTTEYTDKFLKNCGIDEEDIRKKIALVSNGHPYYLDLSVDTYFSLKNRGETIDVDCFGNEKKDILERFIVNLNSIEIELLKIMSIPNYYNFEIFSHLIDVFNIPYPATQFSSFNQYSFITRSELMDRYYIHQLMHQGMNDYIDEDLKFRVNHVMYDYFEKKYAVNKKDNIFDCIYHKLQISKTPEEFFSWINDTKLDYLIYLQVYGESILLSNLFGEIRNKYELYQFPIKLFIIYEDMIHLSGSYKESVSMSEAYLANFSEEEIYNNKDLIKLRYRIIHHKMFYVNADELFSELLEVHEKISKDRFFVEYCETLYMLGGGVGFLTGELDRCKKYLDTLIDLINELPSKSEDLTNIYIRAIRKIVDYNRINGSYEVAKELCEKYYESNKINRYQIYLLCSYGDIHRCQKNYHEAISCYEQVLSKSKALGIKGWLAHAYLALANISIDLNDISKAKNYIDIAKLIYSEISQQWGRINSDIMIARLMLKDENNHESAIKLLEQARRLAIQYGYEYEIGLIDTIINTKNIGEQQLLYV